MKSIRRPAPKISRHAAATECARDEWKCTTCSAPAQEESLFCAHCASYWEDDGEQGGDDYRAGENWFEDADMGAR